MCHCLLLACVVLLCCAPVMYTCRYAAPHRTHRASFSQPHAIWKSWRCVMPSSSPSSRLPPLPVIIFGLVFTTGFFAVGVAFLARAVEDMVTVSSVKNAAFVSTVCNVATPAEAVQGCYKKKNFLARVSTAQRARMIAAAHMWRGWGCASAAACKTSRAQSSTTRGLHRPQLVAHGRATTAGKLRPAQRRACQATAAVPSSASCRPQAT